VPPLRWNRVVAARAGQERHLDDIALDLTDLKGYLANSPYFGAIIGRYGTALRREIHARGKEYTLARNNGPNSIMEALKGFNKVVWQAERSKTHRDRVILTYTSRKVKKVIPEI